MPTKNSSHESERYVNDAKRLLMLRKGLKLSQRAFAAALGVPESTYRQYERYDRPVPLDLRRTIGKLTTLDVNPLDPNEDPREVLEALRTLSPDDLAQKLRKNVQKSGLVQPIVVRRVDPVPTSRSDCRPSIFQRILAFRAYCQRSRTELYTRPRQTYNNIRDFVFMVAVNYIFLKTLSIKLDFPFGAAKDGPDVALIVSFGLFFCLVIAVFQSVPIGLRRDSMRR